MKTDNFTSIEANSGHELITKIGKDRIKRLAKPDTSKMISISVPSLRLTYYVKNKTRMDKRIREIKKLGREYFINN
jgi:hypothetical protein